MKKIAVLLSGCGFKDGAEITESVSTLIALSQNGTEYDIYSLNETVPSTHHLSDQPLGEQNLLEASARISRGKAENISTLDVNNYDAVVLPGGFGAALHFCDFAKKGAQCDVHPEVSKVIKEFYNQSKPIGAFCIAPALISKILGEYSPNITIGYDAETAKEIEKTGAQHVNCKVTDYVTDRENKIITSPAYMYDMATPFEVFTGISAAIKEIVEMA